MPFHNYRCDECGKVYKGRKQPKECPNCKNTHFSICLSPFSASFFELQDEFKGKSKLKDSEKVLRERARNYSREHEMHDLTQTNSQGDALKNGWIKEDGTTRKKVDDL